jgi:hypothetical protein
MLYYWAKKKTTLNPLKNKLKIATIFLLGTLLAFSCDNAETKKGRFLLKGNEKLKQNDPSSSH